MIDVPPPIVHYVEAPHRLETAEQLIYNFFKFDKGEELILIPLEGGLTGSTYSFAYRGAGYVLKFLDEKASLSKILQEMWISQLASEKGIGPEVIYFNLEERFILMHFVSGSALSSVSGDGGAEALEKLKRMHNSIDFEPFSSIHQRGDALLKKMSISDPELKEALSRVSEIQDLASASAMEFSLCHGDLHGGNILVGAEGVRLLDFGSSCFGHPYSDLAKLTFSNSYADALDSLKIYLGRDPKPREEALFYMMRLLCYMTIATNRYMKSDLSSENRLYAQHMIRLFLKEITSSDYEKYKNSMMKND